MKRLLFLLALFLWIANPAFSQQLIEGTVYDSETRESLPSATVLLEGTYRGTITNDDGHFSITVNQFPATLIIRYIGFESSRIEVTNQTPLPLDVNLKTSVTELGEIVVTEKDPGLTIMERVIARKQIWRTNLETYQAEAYTRQILSNDTSIVSISESSSVIFWDDEEGHREIQVFRRQTSNISEDQNFAGVNYQPNFYDDNIEIAGYNVVGITHPDAPKFYNFELEEIQQMDGKPVYKIAVSPRRERQPTFIGTAWVLGRDYALLEVDLKPNEVVDFPPPIQEFNLSYQQQFSNYGGEFWLPVDMRVDGTVRVGMVGLRFPPFLFKQTSRISDYQVNVALPDSIYEEDDIFIKADSTFIERREGVIEAIPLTDQEAVAYQEIDSTRTFEEAFKPEGFLANMIDMDEDESDNDDSGFFGTITGWVPDGIGLKARFNRVDGYHLGLKYEKNFGDIGLEMNGFGGYSFNSEFWDGGLSINKNLFEAGDSDIILNVGYEYATDTRFSSPMYSLGFNSLQTLVLGTRDYFDYFRNEKMFAGLTIEDLFPEFDVTVTANREHHNSFDNTPVFNYSLLGLHDDRRPNPLIDDGTLQSISMNLAYKKVPTDFGFSGKNQVLLSAEHIGEGLGSDFDFTRFSARIDLHIPTFYSRRLFPNALDLTFAGGTYLGDLPLQRFGSVDGAMSRFTPFGVIKTRKSIPYVGSNYWAAYGEHNFRTIPFELIGLDYFVDKGWGIIVFGGAGYADAEAEEPYNLLISDDIHTEIGASLNSVFGVVRLDFAKRLDAPGFFIGFSVPRYF